MLCLLVHAIELPAFQPGVPIKAASKGEHSAMLPDKTWRDVFTDWPAGIPHRGIVVSTINESVPFKGFMIKGDTLLLERNNPDALGARFVLLAFDAINCLKFVDPLKESVFTAAGFTGKFAKE